MLTVKQPEAAPRSEAPSVSIAVGGFIPFSLVDWPGALAAVVFTQGCPWRCHYCHNPHLIPRTSRATASPAWPAIYDCLAARCGFLDGVVFSGGEPTLQDGLPDAMLSLRALGYRIGLHSGAPSCERFSEVLPAVDWVGFDFKAPFVKYPQVTRRASGHETEAALLALLESGTAYEIRTTWHPDLLDPDDLTAMAEILTRCGVSSWQLQRFRPTGCLEPSLRPLHAGEMPPIAALRSPLLEISFR